MPSIDRIIEDFDVLEDWDDRYRYIIELGRDLEPLAPDLHNEANRVKGCVSQVWLETRRTPEGALHFVGDSDAHIVKGLIAIMLALYSDRQPDAILATDVAATYEQLGLGAHLTPQRSNGVKAMVERIKHDARTALKAA